MFGSAVPPHAALCLLILLSFPSSKTQTHTLPFPHTQNTAQQLHLQSKTQATISPSLPQLNGSTFSGTTLLQLCICRRYPSLTHNSFSPSLTLSSSLPQPCRHLGFYHQVCCWVLPLSNFYFYFW